ncbi:MAG: hypothetical protein ACUVR4_01610 [Anaerolineae bacterium]
MDTLIILATTMALFGVLGYLRGTRSTLITTAIVWLGLLIMNRAGEAVARTINGLNYAVRFILAGGLDALGGEDLAAALEEVFARIGRVEPLIRPDGTGPGMLLVFLSLVIIGFLLGTLSQLKGRSSFLGLALGLANGYVLAAFVIRTLLPEATIGLSLPGWLFGPGAAGPVTAPTPAGPSVIGTLVTRSVATLNQLADSGQLALVLAITIVAFVLLVTRLGTRSAKKG